MLSQISASRKVKKVFSHCLDNIRGGGIFAIGEVVELKVSNSVGTKIFALEKKTAKLRGIEKALVARHEAGHAVVGTAVANILAGQPRVEEKGSMTEWFTFWN
ncbi:ATP-dependent zinc metalloprotease FTSH, chloroplastic-like isoform X1 [Glycine soja]|uniref:ATP-dependent zinc metalloprotease FTSH, chloroplastic-like isoform X1 n=1 Tax=Glycine soja TaxID=3848 RepID=UPI00103BB94E|nr:ATP-dependent zinc metalloprotease FTSH, chloroplastic-like isoform X1 [Glycine soja]